MRYLKAKTHISWIITAICLGFLGGVALAKLLPDEAVDANRLSFLLIAGVVLSVIAMLSRLRLLVPVAVLAGVLLGIVRGADTLEQLRQYRQYVGNDVIVEGVVDGDPDATKEGVSLSLDNIAIAPVDSSNLPAKKLIGRIWLRLDDTDIELRRYDQVVIEGMMDSGFGAYGATLQRAQLIDVNRSDGDDLLGKLRSDFSVKLSDVMNESEVGLGMGLLAGQKSVLDEDVQDAFVAASLTHILVASGYNLTVLVRFARRLFAKRSRLIALLFSVLFIILFAGLTGSSASMNRAMVVSILSLLLWYVGRKMHPVVLLSTVAAATIAVNPIQLWGDVGWYLSFGSFAGVIILAPLINDLLVQLLGRQSQSNNNSDADTADLTVAAKLARKLGGIPGSLVQILVETTSAQIVTLPIIAWFMGEVSLVGLMTNILVLPLLPLAMTLTFVSGVGAIILPLSWAQVIAVPARWMLDFIIGVAQWGATLPGASIEFRPTEQVMIIYCLVLLVVTVSLKIITDHNFYGDNVVE